ncbi:hypothetical protein NXS19_003155 [Fusarium pseudograminearum]|nr:hypothetical protein NXS19_003155 [Fusarium pseudograminearum]
MPQSTTASPGPNPSPGLGVLLPLQGSPHYFLAQFQLELARSCPQVPFWGGKGGDTGQFDSRVIHCNYSQGFDLNPHMAPSSSSIGFPTATDTNQPHPPIGSLIVHVGKVQEACLALTQHHQFVLCHF